MRPLQRLGGVASRIAAAYAMKRLDTAARRRRPDREASLHGTVRWLGRAQDATPDDGVSYGYSFHEGWTFSYPETTGYIMQSLLWYHDLFGGESIPDRVRRMARWEADIQMADGAIPRRADAEDPLPVAFNTGQVLLGWSEYLRRGPDARVRDAAARAGHWLVGTMRDNPYFAGGVSAEAQHGDLSYNAMVSWGLAEVAEVLGDSRLADAAHRSATHYAGLVDGEGWPYRSGFSDADSAFPLTHTLGYTIQGLLETGRLLGDKSLIQAAKGMLEAARRAIDARSGFLPGRMRPGWRGGTRWACLTGSAQFAYSYARLAALGEGEADYVALASALVDHVVGTQVDEREGPQDVAYGVRGSYPFALRGYQAATFPNWAAKFLVDALVALHRLGRLRP